MEWQLLVFGYKKFLAKECLVKLEQILGENDAEVVRAKVSYELEVV